MSTLENINAVALNHFSKYGYMGTSLSTIAAEVNIKKQSIYTYYKSKDELFLAICHHACLKEIDVVSKYLHKAKDINIREILFEFLLDITNRFSKEESLQFMLRNSFLPPAHIEKECVTFVYTYLDYVHGLFIQIIKHAQNEGDITREIDAEIIISSYLAMLDALFVELLYGDEKKINNRLSSTWKMFLRGL